MNRLLARRLMQETKADSLLQGYRNRPVKPEDDPLFTVLFKTLLPTTIYYRFFGALKELNPEMLAHFTQINYDREMALVAIDEDSESDCMLGVARIIDDPDGKTGEFAVLVGDAWHKGKGIGSNLLEICLSIAEKKGFKRFTVSCRMRIGTCSRWEKNWGLK